MVQYESWLLLNLLATCFHAHACYSPPPLCLHASMRVLLNQPEGSRQAENPSSNPDAFDRVRVAKSPEQSSVQIRHFPGPNPLGGLAALFGFVGNAMGIYSSWGSLSEKQILHTG